MRYFNRVLLMKENGILVAMERSKVEAGRPVWEGDKTTPWL
jgi:hypothetical protein